MAERDDLLASISDTIRDYRTGEIPRPTPDHVDRWIRQFDAEVQDPILRELDSVLKRNYVSKAKALELFGKVVDYYPYEFWRMAHVLDIQEQGSSQSEILELVGTLLKQKCGPDVDFEGTSGGDYIYLDDAIFTGERVIRDLSIWIKKNTLEHARIRIMTIAIHEYAKP